MSPAARSHSNFAISTRCLPPLLTSLRVTQGWGRRCAGHPRPARRRFDEASDRRASRAWPDVRGGGSTTGRGPARGQDLRAHGHAPRPSPVSMRAPGSCRAVTVFGLAQDRLRRRFYESGRSSPTPSASGSCTIEAGLLEPSTRPDRSPPRAGAGGTIESYLIICYSPFDPCIAITAAAGMARQINKIHAAWIISGVAMLGAVMSIPDTTIVNVALATLGKDLHSNPCPHPVVDRLLPPPLAAVIPVTGQPAPLPVPNRSS